MTASYLKLQLIKCNFLDLMQSPGFEYKLLELAEHRSSTNLAFSRPVFTGWVHLGCICFFFFLHGFQACYQRHLFVIYHRLKGFWLRGPWKCEWPQIVLQIRQFQKFACTEPVLSIPSTRSAQICWGRSIVAVLLAKLCWAWGTVWITDDKPCVHADTPAGRELITLAWD